MQDNILVRKLKQLFSAKKDNLINNTQLANILNIHASQVSTYNNKDLFTPLEVVNLIEKVKISILHSAIKPIVEYLPITPVDSLQEVRKEIFPIRDENGNEIKFNKNLKSILQTTRGVYVFYDSTCKPIYIGKTKGERTNFWLEITNAMNRERSTVIKTVDYNFEDYFEQTDPKIISHKPLFYEIVSYISVYEVSSELIDIIEPLLIRINANILFNSKIEKFKKTR